MRTHYLGLEEVRAYLRDLAARIIALATEAPSVLCPIGRSGELLVEQLLDVEPDLGTSISIVPVAFDRKTGRVSLTDSDPAADIQARQVLVIDSSVHSGGTMARAVQHVQSFRPSALFSYTLVMKRSSSFVPTWWGVTIDDHDRAYFLLDHLPNNRLRDRSFAGHLRLLSKDDLGRPLITAAVPSMDRVTWGDRYFDMKTSDRERRTYVLEVGDAIFGYVTLSRPHDSELVVDEVAVDKAHEGAGYGGALIRWADTYARQTACAVVHLWAIEKQIEKYEHFGYRLVSDGEALALGDEVYRPMTKKVLSHL